MHLALYICSCYSNVWRLMRFLTCICFIISPWLSSLFTSFTVGFLFVLFYFSLQKCTELSITTVLFPATEYSADLASWTLLLLSLFSGETYEKKKKKKKKKLCGHTLYLQQGGDAIKLGCYGEASSNTFSIGLIHIWFKMMAVLSLIGGWTEFHATAFKNVIFKRGRGWSFHFKGGIISSEKCIQFISNAQRNHWMTRKESFRAES